MNRLRRILSRWLDPDKEINEILVQVSLDYAAENLRMRELVRRLALTAAAHDVGAPCLVDPDLVEQARRLTLEIGA